MAVYHMGPQDVRDCEQCPFGGPRVGVKGDPESPIVFVAESPGQQELKEGVPLIGPSGKLFHQFVPNDDKVYILNAMQCHPRKRRSLSAAKNEALTNEAARVCRPRLIEQIQAHPRRLVVAMGNAAMRSLTGDYSLKITQARGQLIPAPELSELGILPIIHTAALLRGTGSLAQWRRDVDYALHMGWGGEPRKHLQAEVEYVSERSPDLPLVLEYLASQKELTADIETSDLHPLRGYILSVGITIDSDPGHGYCFHPNLLPMLKPLFESPDIKWCWHNGKFDVRWLRLRGIDARVDDDTMLMSYALDESSGIHGLEVVAKDLLGAPDYKHMLKPWLPNKKTSYAEVPYDVLGKYQAIDTSSTSQIRRVLQRKLAGESESERLYKGVLIPASEMLSRVEDNGFYIDPERLKANGEYYQVQLQEAMETLNSIAKRALGKEVHFLPSSPIQVAQILFDEMKFPRIKKNSTDASVIATLQERFGNNDFFQSLLDYRKASKMYGTYVKGMSTHICDDGRIHPTYKIHGTRTGRLSCSDPNLQNIPRDPRMKSQFAAAPGHYLIEMDLSQARVARTGMRLGGSEDGRGLLLWW